jgi:formylglycine-generating enzyme required for sulfatase activity
MKRILGIAVVLGLMGALTFIAGCSKGKAPLAKESSGEEEVIDLGKGVKLTMVLIPAGKFMMGSPTSETGRENNEIQHEVSLTKPFYMGKYELTQEQWEAVMGESPWDKKTAKHPVTGVSGWGFNNPGEDRQGFMKQLNAKTNGGYRLPTEAEWEYACRAGTSTAYSFGNSLTKSDANIIESKIGKSVAVGSYKPNAFGLYDMHGNVREFVEDWYAEYPKGSVTDPKGPAGGKERVIRGGDFEISGAFGIARSSSRGPWDPKWFGDHRTGFRLAKDK